MFPFKLKSDTESLTTGTHQNGGNENSVFKQQRAQIDDNTTENPIATKKKFDGILNLILKGEKDDSYAKETHLLFSKSLLLHYTEL